MKYLVLLLVISCGTYGIAQESSCTNALYDANKLYEGGRFQDAVNMLEPCVTGNKLNGKEQFDASRLVALCYIYLNNAPKAESYVVKMLKLRPDYQLYPYVDPREMSKLLDGYEVSKKLDIGLSTGVTLNQVRIIENYSTANTPSTYTAKTGFGVGLIAEYHLNTNLSLLLTPNFNTINYLREMENVAGRKKEYSELMTTIEIPLACRYYLGLGKWKLFGQAGLQYNRLLSGYADVQSTSLIDESVFQSSTETTPYRNKNIFGLNGAIGFSRPMGIGTVSFGINYKYFLPNLAIPEERYENTDFILSAQYIDSDFSINALGFNVGFQLPFLYSVKKLKIKNETKRK